MDLFTLLIVLALIVFAFWVTNKYTEGIVKKVLNITVVVAVVIWVLKLIGFFEFLKGIKL